MQRDAEKREAERRDLDYILNTPSNEWNTLVNDFDGYTRPNERSGIISRSRGEANRQAGERICW